MEHLWPGSPLVFLLAWFGWRVAAKAGYSGFWGLTALVPPLGLIALWYLAMVKDWPKGEMKTINPGPASHEPKGVAIRRPTAPASR